jgi:hypothetical protein
MRNCMHNRKQDLVEYSIRTSFNQYQKEIKNNWSHDKANEHIKNLRRRLTFRHMIEWTRNIFHETVNYLLIFFVKIIFFDVNPPLPQNKRP